MVFRNFPYTPFISYVIIYRRVKKRGTAMWEKPRKFIILTASIGTGHSQAARAIAEAIQKTHPADSVSVLDFVSNNKFSMDHMIKDTYLKMIDVFPAMYDHLYSDSQNSRFGQLSQKMLSLTFKKRMSQLVSALKPDAVIFTHPFPAGAADLLKGEGKMDIPLLGVITDFDIHQLWVDPYLDAFCVATADLKSLMETYQVPEDKIHVTGIPVRHSFYEQAKKERAIEKGSVLVMGGGLGLGNVVDNIQRLDEVEEISKFIVITGKNISLYEKVAELSDKLHHPVELHSYTNKVAEIMARSEILVTKPGALTCTEAMIMHLPMVLVNTLPGQERANALHMKKQGCAEWVKRGELSETVRRILRSGEIRERMVRTCGDEHPDSAGNVVDVLYSILN